MNKHKYWAFCIMVAALALVSLTTQAGQNFATNVAQMLNTGTITYLQTDNQGALLTGQGASSTLDLTAATVVQVGAGRVGRVSVLVAGAAGALYDGASTSGNTAANEIAVIPATVGNITIDFPFTTGLVYIPGASQIASITYNK